jgi:hypothetical protein
MSGTNQLIVPAETPRPRLLRDPLLYGVAAFAVAVCGAIFRYLGWLGDEGIILHGAVRLLGGETIYRDFFELGPPGAFVGELRGKPLGPGGPCLRTGLVSSTL